MPIIACFTVALAMIISGNLQTVVSTVNDLNNKSALNEYIGTMIKALGISYITVVTAEICRSAGEETLAKISEIAGKFEILALSLPMALKLIDIASEIL